MRFMRLAVVLVVACAGPVAAQDTREAAVRTPVERAFILDQMRLFLTSVQGITAGLAEGDMKTVGAEAYARGRRANATLGMPPGMKAKETPVWGTLMGGVRKGFDDIADEAAAGAPPLKVLGDLSGVMRNLRGVPPGVSDCGRGVAG